MELKTNDKGKLAEIMLTEARKFESTEHAYALFVVGDKGIQTCIDGVCTNDLLNIITSSIDSILESGGIDNALDVYESLRIIMADKFGAFISTIQPNNGSIN